MTPRFGTFDVVALVVGFTGPPIGAFLLGSIVPVFCYVIGLVAGLLVAQRYAEAAGLKVNWLGLPVREPPVEDWDGTTADLMRLLEDRPECLPASGDAVVLVNVPCDWRERLKADPDFVAHRSWP